MEDDEIEIDLDLVLDDIEAVKAKLKGIKKSVILTMEEKFDRIIKIQKRIYEKNSSDYRAIQDLIFAYDKLDDVDKVKEYLSMITLLDIDYQIAIIRLILIAHKYREEVYENILLEKMRRYNNNRC